MTRKPIFKKFHKIAKGKKITDYHIEKIRLSSELISYDIMLQDADLVCGRQNVFKTNKAS